MKGSSEIADQGQGAKGAKDKGKDKGTKPPLEAKDTTKVKEVEAKAKEVEAKTKEADRPMTLLPSSKARKKFLLLQRPRLNN